MVNEIFEKRALPVMALRNLVVFPEQTVCFEVGRTKSIKAIRSAVDTTDRLIFLVTQKDAMTEDPKFEELYDIGVVAEIKQISGDGKSFEIVVEGLYRAKISEILKERFSMRAVVEQTPEIFPNAEDFKTVAALRLLKENVEEYVNDFIKIYKQSDKTSTSERKINDVKTRIDKEKNKRDKLFDLYVDGSMEKKEFTERNDVINSVIKELEEELTALEKTSEDDSKYLENIKKIQNYFQTLYEPDVEMDKVAVDEMVKVIIDRIDVYPVTETSMRLEVKLKMGGVGDITYIRNGERYGRRSGIICKKMIQKYEQDLANGQN